MAEPVAETFSCRILTLPPELLIPAAHNASDIYPPNALLTEQIANVLGATAAAHVLTPDRIAASTDRYWGPQVRVLSVQFLDNPTQACRRMILEAANSWGGGLSFAETAGLGDVRLTRAGLAYASYLGTDIRMVPAGQPTMWLGQFTEFTRAAEYLRVPPHEFGHSKGYVHEHLRADLVELFLVNETIAYYAETQGWSEETTRSNVLTALNELSLMRTPVDVLSIMCYWAPGKIIRGGKPIMGGLRLTASDLAFDHSIYPLPAPPPPVEPPKPKPPEPPPVKPPGPTEPDAGPFDLEMGRASDTFTMIDSGSILFRFRPKGHRTFVAQTGGKLELTMELLDATRKLIEADTNHKGKVGNALIARALRPGTYFLRVRGIHSEVTGPFRIKVEALT